MDRDPYRYFRIEARELLGGMSEASLEIERGAAVAPLVARILHMAHTLKGAARVVRQPEVAELAHAIEDGLAPWRERCEPVPRETTSRVLHQLDAIAARLASLDAPGGSPSGDSPAVAGSAGERSSHEAPGGRACATLATTSAETAGPQLDTVRVEIAEMDDLLEGVAEASVLLEALHAEVDALDRTRRLAALLGDQLARPAAAAPNGVDGSAGPAARARSLAADVRSALDRLHRGLSSGLDQAQVQLADVRHAADRLRLLPAATIFAPLDRAVHDAAEALCRSVRLTTSGGEIRLDAHVVAAARDALLHVVRNAVAHGIEPEAERLAAGKPPCGSVHLRVERRASRIAFVCSDDGRGIDVEAVRCVALAKGLLGEAEAAALAPDDLARLLLEGKITTAPRATEICGRGIGLDVVRETAARLRGEVSVRSERGVGATVEICVPISLSSLPALLLEAGGLTVSVPLDAVCRTLRLLDGDVARSADHESVLYEGRAIPFLSLAQALGCETRAASLARSWPAVVLRRGDALAALGVDRLLGITDLVVRRLPAALAGDPLVAGVVLDTRGDPQLVLDAEGLVAAAARARWDAERASPVRARPAVLIIDDSLTTRMLEQSILESAGYAVDCAVSGEEALSKARDTRYGLFLTDVEMPGMDGYEFVAATRADPELREVPAILVTSRSSPEDRRRGAEVGAAAFITKSEFDQGRLLETIRGLTE